MKFAVIGHPISHSLSPVMHNANFTKLGLDYTYEALDIPIEDFHLIKEIITEKGSMDLISQFHIKNESYLIWMK